MKKPHYAVLSILGVAVAACAWLLSSGRTIAAIAVLAVGFNLASAVVDLSKGEEERKP